MNICQRIVSQVGRRVDESIPICDARLPDGSRVNVIAPPLAIDGPTLTIRKFKKDKLTLDQLVKFGTHHPRRRHHPRDHRPLALQRPGLRRHRLGQDDAAQLPDPLHRRRRAHHHLRGRRRAAAAAAACRAPRNPPAEYRGRGRDHHARSRQELPAHAPRADHRRRGARHRRAFDLLQAMNTGHDGSMGTLHANSPREALSRLESMITMGGFKLPSKTLREMISTSIDVIVQAERLRDGTAQDHPHHRGDRHRGRRHHHPGHLRLRDGGRGRERPDHRPPHARPASAGRRSGIAPATSTRRSASRPPSTPPTREEAAAAKVAKQ